MELSLSMQKLKSLQLWQPCVMSFSSLYLGEFLLYCEESIADIFTDYFRGTYVGLERA